MAFTTTSRQGEALGALAGDEMHLFLEKTSRTFALTIPMLPEPLRTEIGVAYLLFRVIDTFEDATNWSVARRVDALKDFIRLLDERDPEQMAAVVAAWVRDPPTAHPGYLELLRATPRVLGCHRGLGPAASVQIRNDLARSALGMCKFVLRTDGDGVLRLTSIQDLRDYCYVVAGIVGEMLTQLFVLSDDARLARVAPQLRARSVRFGEGLQLVNILKDAAYDATEGRVYLPREVLLAEVFLLARADLRAAAEYTELLRESGTHRGLVTFNALNARLAIGTLRLMRDRGLGTKLTRLQVAGIASEVAHALDVGAPLFEDSERQQS